MTPSKALTQAIDLAQGKVKLAALITEAMPHLVKPVLRQHVENWLEAQNVPAMYCPTIERITAVRCEYLCPGTDWAVLRAGDTSAA